MRRLAAALAVVAIVLAACTGTTPTAGALVELYEGRIDASSTVLRSGPIAVDIVNEGEFDHTLVITSAEGTVVAATELVPPGGEARLEVTLAPGAYQFTCRIVSQSEDGRIFDHYQMGMSRPVTVEG